MTTTTLEWIEKLERVRAIEDSRGRPDPEQTQLLALARPALEQAEPKRCQQCNDVLGDPVVSGCMSCFWSRRLLTRDVLPDEIDEDPHDASPEMADVTTRLESIHMKLEGARQAERPAGVVTESHKILGEQTMDDACMGYFSVVPASVHQRGREAIAQLLATREAAAYERGLREGAEPWRTKTTQLKALFRARANLHLGSETGRFFFSCFGKADPGLYNTVEQAAAGACEHFGLLPTKETTK